MACPVTLLLVEAWTLPLGPAPHDTGRGRGPWPAWNENPMRGFSQMGTQGSVAQGQVYSLAQLKVHVSESKVVCGYQSKYAKMMGNVNLDICARAGSSLPKKRRGSHCH